MKKIQMVIPIVLILMLASFTTPVLATKGKNEKIEYTLFGNIRDKNTEEWGYISLTFNGVIKGTPDYEDETIVEGPIDYSGEYDYENYWYDGILDWKAVVHYSYEVVGYQSIKSYVAKWNSPQPTYNGKLVAIWNDGFTATFSVSLSPVLIEKSYDEGYSNIEEASFSLVQEFYWFDAENDQWVYDRTETESDSYSGSGTYGSSTLIIQFSTKIQSKGRPPIREDYPCGSKNT